MNVLLALAVVLGALLAFGAAQLTVSRYRRAMVTLMSAATAAAAAAAVPAVAPPPRASVAAVSRADNRAAGWRVSVLLVVLVLLIGATSAVVTIVLPGNAVAFSWNRIVTVAAAQSWPALPALALLWHWSRTRLALAMLAWLLVVAAVVMWRSDANATWSSLFAWLVVVEAGTPLAIGALLTAGRATRAVAPWLWPLLAAAVAAVLLALEVVLGAGAEPPAWFLPLARAVGAYAALGLLVLCALGLAWWPLARLGRALAAAYRRKWLTELMVVFAALVGVVQVLRVVFALGSNGLMALAHLAPLVWIPLGLAVSHRLGRPDHRTSRPPQLLVLRVFQRDEAVNRLFDEVIERWRLTGNTTLIAGTDLLERTIDAEDIYLFLGGRLRERFVLEPADLAPRLAAFDLERDADGRYRINEVYCHDRTWELALDALVARADVVLMDLRGFQSRNRGCRHELGVLARAQGLGRVVVLVDEHTDRVDAQAAAAGAPAGRFEWVDAAQLGRGSAAAVLARLFAPA